MIVGLAPGRLATFFSCFIFVVFVLRLNDDADDTEYDLLDLAETFCLKMTEDVGLSVLFSVLAASLFLFNWFRFSFRSGSFKSSNSSNISKFNSSSSPRVGL